MSCNQLFDINNNYGELLNIKCNSIICIDTITTEILNANIINVNTLNVIDLTVTNLTVNTLTVNNSIIMTNGSNISGNINLINGTYKENGNPPKLNLSVCAPTIKITSDAQYHYQWSFIYDPNIMKPFYLIEISSLLGQSPTFDIKIRDETNNKLIKEVTSITRNDYGIYTLTAFSNIPTNASLIVIYYKGFLGNIDDMCGAINVYMQ